MVIIILLMLVGVDGLNWQPKLYRLYLHLVACGMNVDTRRDGSKAQSIE